MVSRVTGLPYGALLACSKSRWPSCQETGLNVIYPADYQNEAQASRDMALLGHEVELHYHCQELKEKYGEGKIFKNNEQ